MPKVPIDYSKTCIYKLVHKDDVDNENIYIGSTTDFRKRKNEHKSRIFKIGNQHYNQKKYVYIRENGGWDNWIMIEIEKYPCNDKREAETRERYWIDHYKSKLNSAIPTRTLHEWYLDNKEIHNANAKLYYDENKEYFRQQKKQYYENNKQSITIKNKEYVQNNLEKTKENNKKWREENTEKLKNNSKKYYQENYEKISQQNKELYIKNRDKILEKQKLYTQNNKEKIKSYQKEIRSVKITCECGCDVGKFNLKKHILTAKHLKLMSELIK